MHMHMGPDGLVIAARDGKREKVDPARRVADYPIVVRGDPWLPTGYFLPAGADSHFLSLLRSAL